MQPAVGTSAASSATAPPGNSRPRGWAPRGDYAAVPLLFFAVGLLLQRDGHVPLGDSWSYIWTTAQFVQHGRMALTDWQAMTLVGQVLLASPVAAVFSPDPSVLNRFTLVLAALTLGLFLRIYRMLGLGRGLSLLGVGTLAANPIWLAQSMAFETEIPFLFFAALGTLALLTWDRSRHTRSLWAAGIAFAGAAAVRQHAVVFAAAGLLYALQSAWARPRLWIPWFLPPIVVAAYYLVLHVCHCVPLAFEWQQQLIHLRWTTPGLLLSSSCFSLIGAAHYLGQFLLPVSTVGVRRPATRAHAVLLTAGAVLLIAATGILWFGYGDAMPYLPHLIDPNFVLVTLGIAANARTTALVWTALSLLAGLVLFASVAGAPPASESKSCVSGPARRFLVTSACLMIGFNLVTGLGFDRYLLLPLPFLIPALLRGRSVSARRLGLAAALLAVSVVTSMLLVDQRVRVETCLWDMAQELRQSGIEPRRINGGVGFNGYYTFATRPRGPKGDRFASLNGFIQPDAEFLVVPVAVERPGLALLRTRRCPNLPGFRDIEARTYQCPPKSPADPASRCQPF